MQKGQNQNRNKNKKTTALTISSVGEDMEQLKFSYIVGGTVHWYNHCGKFAASTKKQHPFHTLKPSNSMSKYSPNNAFAHENMYKNKLSIFYMFINIIYIFINMYHYSL